MKVKLTYFKPSGKWYANGEYETEHRLLFNIYDEVRSMQLRRRLPGLSEGHTQYYVYIQVPEHVAEVPHLIVPREPIE